MALVRFGVSLEDSLLERFDGLIERKGYPSRSEAIRDLIRDYFVVEDWKADTSDAVGTITIVYNHEKRELVDVLTDLQHKHYSAIISSMHIHLDEHNCLEVIVVKGKVKDIRSIADRLIATKGVKHGKLFLITTGKGLE